MVGRGVHRGRLDDAVRLDMAVRSSERADPPLWSSVHSNGGAFWREARRPVVRLGDYERARTDREKAIRMAIGAVVGLGCAVVLGLGALIVRAFNGGRIPDWVTWLGFLSALAVCFVAEWVVGARRKGGG